MIVWRISTIRLYELGQRLGYQFADTPFVVALCLHSLVQRLKPIRHGLELLHLDFTTLDRLLKLLLGLHDGLLYQRLDLRRGHAFVALAHRRLAGLAVSSSSDARLSHRLQANPLFSLPNP